MRFDAHSVGESALCVCMCIDFNGFSLSKSCLLCIRALLLWFPITSIGECNRLHCIEMEIIQCRYSAIRHSIFNRGNHICAANQLVPIDLFLHSALMRTILPLSLCIMLTVFYFVSLAGSLLRSVVKYFSVQIGAKYSTLKSKSMIEVI